MQSSGCIDDDMVKSSCFGRLDRVVDHGGGVMPLSCGDNWYFESVRPADELFDGRGTESVSRSQNDTFALLLVTVGKFGDGGGLSCTVDTDDHFDIGFCIALFPVCFVLENGDERVESLDTVDLFRQLFKQSFKQFIIDIRFKKDIFELLLADLFLLFRNDLLDGIVGLSQYFFEQVEHGVYFLLIVF